MHTMHTYFVMYITLFSIQLIKAQQKNSLSELRKWEIYTDKTFQFSEKSLKNQ